MIATYQEHTIEAIREGENWTTTIDGQASGVKASKSKIWAIKWAMQAIDEQEEKRRQAELNLALNDYLDRLAFIQSDLID